MAKQHQVFQSAVLPGALSEEEVKRTFEDPQRSDREAHWVGFSGNWNMTSGIEFLGIDPFGDQSSAEAYMQMHCKKWGPALAARYRAGETVNWIIGAWCANGGYDDFAGGAPPEHPQPGERTAGPATAEGNAAYQAALGLLEKNEFLSPSLLRRTPGIGKRDVAGIVDRLTKEGRIGPMDEKGRFPTYSRPRNPRLPRKTHSRSRATTLSVRNLPTCMMKRRDLLI